MTAPERLRDSWQRLAPGYARSYGQGTRRRGCACTPFARMLPSVIGEDGKRFGVGRDYQGASRKLAALFAIVIIAVTEN